MVSLVVGSRVGLWAPPLSWASLMASSTHVSGVTVSPSRVKEDLSAARSVQASVWWPGPGLGVLLPLPFCLPVPCLSSALCDQPSPQLRSWVCRQVSPSSFLLPSLSVCGQEGDWVWLWWAEQRAPQP